MAPGDPTAAAVGLTEAEAARRTSTGIAAGKPPETGRTYRDIVATNTFTSINLVFATIGLTLVAMGMAKDAFLSTSLALVNIAIGVVQESIAKHRLDQIALLTRARATVIRDGARREIDPAEIVPGDALMVGAGDQIAVDGKLVEAVDLAVDESLLTGESEPVSKREGDELHSGAYCVHGSGVYVAERVGVESFAGKLTAKAKTTRTPKTPIQRQADLIVRALLLTAGVYLGILFLRSWLHDQPFRETVLSAAVIAGIIPYGMFVMVTVTYSIATVRLAKENALIQQINAVESLSNVDVFCMDKTGTLTANALQLTEVESIGLDETAARTIAGHAVASMAGATKTSEAILSASGGVRQQVVDEIVFSSERKWSAVSLNGPDATGVVVLGAAEMIAAHIGGGPAPQPPEGWEERGLRVLLLATSDEPESLHDEQGQPRLPGTLRPAAWFGFTDELRPNLQETLDGFIEAEIGLKIISGDDPDTVAALVRQAGMNGELRLISGAELDDMNVAEFDEAAAEGTVFGRISPEQKERLMRSLRKQGHYVAMTGDGVNDLLSLKQANLGIAMQSGSQATRAAADIVLLNDSFGSLPKVFLEGQRIRNGLRGIFELFLTRVAAVAAIIAAADVLHASFPFTPGHMSVLTTLTVGIPTFGLALWATPGALPSSLFTALVRFIVPSTLLMSLSGLGVYLYYYFIDGNAAQLGGDAADLAAAALATDTARSALLTFMVLSGLWLVVFASPPTRFWAVCERKSGDWRPTLLALAMIPLYAAVMSTPLLREFFGVRLLRWQDYGVLAAISIALGIALRFVWHWQLIERFLTGALQRSLIPGQPDRARENRS